MGCDGKEDRTIHESPPDPQSFIKYFLLHQRRSILN